MNQIYKVQGRSYSVGDTKLDDFLSKFPDAVKEQETEVKKDAVETEEESGKTTDPKKDATKGQSDTASEKSTTEDQTTDSPSVSLEDIPTERYKKLNKDGNFESGSLSYDLSLVPDYSNLGTNRQRNADYNWTSIHLPDGGTMNVVDGDKPGLENTVTLQQSLDIADNFYAKHGEKASHAEWSLFEREDENSQILNDLDGLNVALKQANTRFGDGYEVVQDIGGYYIKKDGVDVYGGRVQDIGAPARVDAYNASEIQKWFWDNAEDSELRGVREHMVNETTNALNILDEKTEIYREGVSDDEAVNDMFADGTGTDVFMSVLKDSGLPSEDLSEIEGYLRTPITETESTTMGTSIGGYGGVSEKQVVKDGWQRSRFDDILQSDMFVGLPESTQEVVSNAINSRTAIGDLAISSYKDKMASTQRGLMLEDMIRDGFVDANYVRGVLDEKLSPANTARKAKAFDRQLNQVKETVDKKTKELDTTVDGVLQEVKDAGLGFHMEGQGDSARPVVDFYESFTPGMGDKAEALQKRLNDLYDGYDALGRELDAGIDKYNYDYNNFVSNVEEDAIDASTVAKEFDSRDIYRKDWRDGWKSMWYGGISLFGNEAGLKGLDRIENRSQAYETMLTYQQAYELGAGDRFSGRTFTQQAPNFVVAIGASAVGLPPVAATAATATVFASGAGGQRRYELTQAKENAEEAKKSLESLEVDRKKGKVSDAKYYTSKVDLEKTIALGDFSRRDMNLAIGSSFITEFGVTSLFGTIPNSQRFLKAVGGGGRNEIVESATRNWFQNTRRGLFNTGKEIGSEITEETLIEVGNQLGNGLILGRDMDWSNIDDVAVQSIISAGPTQATSNAYAGIMMHTSTRATYDTFKDVQANIASIEASMAEAKTDTEKAAYRTQYQREVSRLGSLTSGLEVDALLSGSKGLKEVFEANMMLGGAYTEAGISVNDSDETKQLKIDEHKAGLSRRKAKAFENKIKAAEEKITGVKSKITKAHEDGTSIETMYGQEGSDTANKLSEKMDNWDDLSNRDKAIAVHRDIQRRQDNARVKEGRKDKRLEQAVEKKVYGMTFDEYKKKTGKKNRRRAAENELMLNYMDDVHVRRVNTIAAREDGNILIEGINSDPNFRDKIVIKTVESKKQIFEELEEALKAGEISKSELDSVVRQMESSGKEATHGAMLTGGKYITISDTESAKADIEAGVLPAGTVVLHEVSHAMDTLAGLTGESMSDYSSKLEEALTGNKDLVPVHLEATMRVDALGLEGVERADEYTKSVQDILSNDYYLSQIGAAKKAAGKTSLRNIVNMARGKGFKINNSKDALNYMMSFIDAAKKGEISQLTKSRIDDDTMVKDIAERRMSKTVNLDDPSLAGLDISEKIDSYTRGAKTKEELYARDPGTRTSAFDDIYMGILEGGFDRVFGEGISPEQRQIQRQELADRFGGLTEKGGYDPAITPELSKWMYGGSGKSGNITYTKLVAKKKLFEEGEKRKREKSIDTKDDKTGKTVAETLADTTETKKVETKRQDKARKLKSFSDVNLENKDVVTKNIESKLESLIKENPLNLIEQIETLVAKDFMKLVKSEMGKISKKGGEVVVSDEYKAFHALGYQDIVKSLDIATIKKKYNNLFELEKIGKEDKVTRKVDKPSLKKDSYYRKDIFKVSTNKAKWTKYFTEGGYTTLLERQKGIAGEISQALTSKAIDKYVAENSGDIDTVIQAELNNYVNSLDRQKSEQLSFDHLSFSKSMRGLPDYQQILFYEKLPDVAKLTNPAFVNSADWKEVKPILEEVYGDDFTSKELTAIAKDLSKISSRFQPTISKGKTINIAEWTDYTINSFKEADESIIQVLGLQIDGKVPTAASLYDTKENIERARERLIAYGNHIVDSGMSLDEVARVMAILKPMYAGNTKVGRGMFKTDANGKVVEVKLKEGESFSTPRNQVFDNTPTFEKFGVMKIKGMTPAIWKNANTKLKAQKSSVAVKDKDYKGRLAEAKEARNVVDSVMSFLTENGNDLDIAMFMISNLSSMNAPLRRAANLRYIADTVLDMDPKKVGKLAEYEHMIPANTMALRVIDAYKNKGGIKDQDKFYEHYNVAIIPKAMDNVLKALGLQSNMLPGHDFDTPSWTRYYNILTAGLDNIVPIRDISNNKIVGPRIKVVGSTKGTRAMDSAIRYSKSPRSKGITVLDFDDTLATTKSQVIVNAPDGGQFKLNAEEFAKQGADLLAGGNVFDFSEFNKVVKGKTAPLFNKALKLASKFGTSNMFILTARAPESQVAIKQFLDANGLNIPLKNITGLGKSEASAKADWVAEKIGEGYNDFYFADDAIQNVRAVKDMLDRFDVKGKVQQARLKFSKSGPLEFDKILEQTKGIAAEKQFSSAKAKQRGKGKGKFKFFVPPSADDFAGLMYYFMGKGKQGDQHQQWFKKNLFDPFSKGMRHLNMVKQSVANDMKELRKAMPIVRKKLGKTIPGTEYTYEDAIRVYNWAANNIDIPGLSKTDMDELIKTVVNDADLLSFAHSLVAINDKSAANVVQPGDHWLGGTIASDLNDSLKEARKTYLNQWIENKDIIFNEASLNKIEAIYGPNFREALEDLLYRMEHGGNRSRGAGRLVNGFTNWIHGSIGTTMFFNARSAILQMISNVNFINWSDNSMLQAAKAFANQPQYWSDVAMIFNSPFLKQRRSGIQTDVNASELLAQIKGSKNKAKAATAYLLQLGFTPTQIADSFAIATGGATMYRNRIKTYLKEGMPQKQAEAKAFEDMMEIAEETQQSAREDRISQQQASPLGKFILAFQNTPMQYNRLIKKAAMDLVNGRGDVKTNVSKIVYYGAIQNMIFYGLQQALFASLFGDDEEDESTDKKKERVINGMMDTLLRGAGIGGAVVSTIKNVILKIMDEQEKLHDTMTRLDKDGNVIIDKKTGLPKQYDNFFSDPDWNNVTIEALNLSPPIGIKARKISSSFKTWEYNRDVIKHMDKMDIDNPMYDAMSSGTEAITNLPLNRLYNKYQNIKEATNSDHEMWQRIAMGLGWSRWNFGLKNQDVMTAKNELKEIKKEEKEARAVERKKEREREKQWEDAGKINKHIEDQEEKRRRGVDEKDIKCAAVNKSGERCGKSVLPGKTYCTIHERVEQRTDGKKKQCTHVKSDGNRCKMKTTNKSGKCYYHD